MMMIRRYGRRRRRKINAIIEMILDESITTIEYIQKKISLLEEQKAFL